MAVLTDIVLTDISRNYQVDLSEIRESLGAVSKADIKAAVVAVDGWVSDNKASFNNSLPAATKSTLTTGQKSNLLFYVVRRRFQEGE